MGQSDAEKAPEPVDSSPTESLTQFSAFVAEYRSESDRAAVVLGAAKLDYLLYQILTKHLLPNAGSRDDLFDSDGPLSTFSAKIHLTHRLGVIDSGFARALHLLRRIRNSFAHEISGCHLDSGAHRDRVRELVAPFESLQLYVKFRQSFIGGETGSRGDFDTILGILALRLEDIHERIQPIPPGSAQPLLRD